MIARRFLQILLKLGIYTKHYKIVYDGDISSANDIWASNNWRTRQGIKDKYNKIFSVLVKGARMRPMKEFSLFIFYNTRHDVDNLFAVAKVMADSMKRTPGLIEDDSRKYYKSMHTIFDDSLPKKTIEFHIVGK